MIARRNLLATAMASSTLGAGTVGQDASAAGGAPLDRDFLEFLTAAADTRARAILVGYPANVTELRDKGKARSAARSIRTLVSVYVYDGSACHHAEELLSPLGELANALAEEQYDDGLWDQGADGSPPDTAFSIVDLNLAYHLLQEDGHQPTAGLRTVIERILRKAGPGLAVGGVHTANHRWLVCAALARLHSRWPNPSYAKRIDAWLAEGIDQMPGGEYSERSPNYAAAVTNPALLVLARHHGRTDLYAKVRASLVSVLGTMEPNGEVETVHSRRQDQTALRYLPEFWLQFREMAIRDGDGRFAAVARLLRERGTDQAFGETALGDRLAQVLDQPELAHRLPDAVPLPTDFERYDASCRLVRVRRGNNTASVFGGTDFPEVHAISSGLSTNPTFFKMRKGAAILDSLRLAPQFFSLGHFRASDLERRADGAWRLSAEVRGAFHLPLTRPFRRPDGDYALTDDGRFWSSMDFPHRPKEYRVLRTQVLVREVTDGAWDISFSLVGNSSPLAIELCFRRGGTLTGDGLEAVSGASDTYQLVSGEATYTVGDDHITFGPGNGKGGRQPAVVDAGERYSWLNGSLPVDGIRVLITGRSPLTYRLSLR